MNGRHSSNAHAAKLTANQVKEDFRRKGVTLADWAKENGFNVSVVYQVLAGQRKCLRGESHKIAEQLGMK
jgi:gp16 family phage-associated protein